MRIAIVFAMPGTANVFSCETGGIISFLPLGCRASSLHFPIFFKKLIEELRGFTPFVHTSYAPGKRLSRWPSFDQAPQEGYAIREGLPF